MRRLLRCLDAFRLGMGGRYGERNPATVVTEGQRTASERRLAYRKAMQSAAVRGAHDKLTVTSRWTHGIGEPFAVGREGRRTDVLPCVDIGVPDNMGMRLRVDGRGAKEGEEGQA